MKIKETILFLLIMPVIAAQSAFAAWRFIPAAPNDVKKGDIILSAKPDSPVGKILKVLGHYWDHCVIVADDSRTQMTNNAFNDALENIIENEGRGIAVSLPIPPWRLAFPTNVPKRFKPEKLSNADYGIITEPIKGMGDFKARLSTSNEENRVHLNEIANYMNNMKGYYILNAFVDLKAYEPVYLGEREYGNGSHCSGTIWWASKYAGKEMSLFTLDNSDGVISACANVMFNSVKKMVQQEIWEQVVSAVSPGKISEPNARRAARKDVYNQIIGKRIDSDDKLAHQIVNTFLFNRSSRTDDYWRGHVDSVQIESFAPDHLLMLGMPDKNGILGMRTAMPGRQQSSTSYYDAITDYSESGGYFYRFFEDDDDSNDPRVSEYKMYDTPCEMGIGVRCCK